MLQSLCGAIRELYCDFSMDREERAIDKYFVVACHLPDNHVHPRQQWRRKGTTDDSACSSRLPFDEAFLSLSQPQK
jgi:hypothetical protein